MVTWHLIQRMKLQWMLFGCHPMPASCPPLLFLAFGSRILVRWYICEQNVKHLVEERSTLVMMSVDKKQNAVVVKLHQTGGWALMVTSDGCMEVSLKRNPHHKIMVMHMHGQAFYLIPSNLHVFVLTKSCLSILIVWPCFFILRWICVFTYSKCIHIFLYHKGVHELRCSTKSCHKWSLDTDQCWVPWLTGSPAQLSQS